MPPFPSTPIARLTGHNGIVHAIAYSSGAQQYILTGCADRTIRLYNPAKAPPTSTTPNAGLVTTFSAHGYEVLSLDVNKDNEKLVSTGGDKAVFYWDVQTAQTIRRWTGHAGRVNRGVFAGDGDSVVVSGSLDGTIKIWDTKSNNYKPIMTLNEARDSITDLCVCDAEIVAGSADGRVRSYDLRMGICSVDFIGSSAVTSVSVTKKGTELLVSSLDNTVRLMDRTNGQLLKAYTDKVFLSEQLRIKSCLGLEDSAVVSGSENGAVVVWDLLEGQVMHRFRHTKMSEIGELEGIELPGSGKREVVSAVTFSERRKEWASAGGDGNVVVWGLD